MHTLQLKGQLIRLQQPIVMGILNLTPDSFFDGGKYLQSEAIVARAQQILDEGATLIDVGAYSSRPDALHIDENEEWRRLSEALTLIRSHFPNIPISVDTFRSGIAQRCVDTYQVDLINDISAGELDAKMFETIARLGIPYVLMHMQGTPQTMQKKPAYLDVTRELLYFFSQKIHQLTQMGVKDIVVDLGFGFGKTIEHNYTLLRELEAFHLLEKPILVGLSRKSMVCKPLNTTPHESLNGTTVLHTIALQKGASVLRVHDVKEAVECIKLVQYLQHLPG